MIVAMTSLFRRLAAREKQFVAWKNLIPERAYKAAKTSLLMTDVLRIVAYAGIVIKVMQQEQKTYLSAFVVIAGSYAVLSLVRAWARDQILANAFATMMPAGSAETIAFPKRPPPTPADPDAQDFDDADVAPPRRRRRVNAASDRDALDFDDAA
jgi:hypothetical protein